MVGTEFAQTAELPSNLRGWAQRINVKRDGDQLVIVGTNHDKARPMDLRQLFKDYVFARTSEREAQGAHLEFANAESDEQLIRFIEKWGPITAPSTGDSDGSKRAVESLRAIRSVQALIVAAVRLLKISREDRPKPDVALEAMRQLLAALEIVREDTRSLAAPAKRVRVIRNTVEDDVRGESEIEAELQREEIKLGLRSPNGTILPYIGSSWPRWEPRDYGLSDTEPNEPSRAHKLGSLEEPELSPHNEFGASGLGVECEVIYQEARARRERGKLKSPDLREISADLLCALVSRFHDSLIATEQGVLTVPAAGHGVLPLLMFMFRQDLVSGRNIIVCEGCGDYRLQLRNGERACSSCKSRLRARRYYRNNNKEILQRRKKKRLAQKGRAGASNIPHRQ